MIKENEYITFQWLASLKGKKIRIGKVEGYYTGGCFKCGSAKIQIQIEEKTIKLENRLKNHIEII